MHPLEIPEPMLQLIYEQARQAYPQECCGVILGQQTSPDSLTRVRPCRNAQDLFHVEDPDAFPRTARTAYFIDPKELLALEKENRANDELIRVIYHSHVDAAAYFSEEDARLASAEGEPIHPGVAYLVISVVQGKPGNHQLFHWDAVQRRFTTLPQTNANRQTHR